MNATTAFKVILNNPTTLAVLGVVTLVALTVFAKLYTFRLSMRGAKPSERPAIMREYRNMWQLRKPPRY